MKEEKSKRGKVNKHGTVPVISKICLFLIVFGFVVIISIHAFGFADPSPSAKIPPLFSVSRVNESIIQVTYYPKIGVDVVEKLLVYHPSKVKGTLNSSVPTGKIKVGRPLYSIGVKPGDHYVVIGTIDGKEKIVINSLP